MLTFVATPEKLAASTFEQLGTGPRSVPVDARGRPGLTPHRYVLDRVLYIDDR
jgi:hypothetical protein